MAEEKEGIEKAKAEYLLDFLKEKKKIRVPFYQRRYSWGKKQCKQLWDDILRIAENENVGSHFTGPIICVAKDKTKAGQLEVEIIDGQQRLTTVTLILVAIVERLEGKKGDVSSEILANKMRSYYMTKKNLKLHLSGNDLATLVSIMNNTGAKRDAEKINENYMYLYNLFGSNFLSKIKTIDKGLEKLEIVVVTLDGKEDDPQQVFQSMNSTGLALSQVDLIKNFVMMNLESEEEQEKLYEECWMNLEKVLRHEKDAKHFTNFMRYYLTIYGKKGKKIPLINKVYEGFKDYYDSCKSDEGNPFSEIRNIMEDALKFSKYFSAIIFENGDGDSDDLKSAFSKFKELEVDTPYPLLLVLYQHYKSKETILGEENFIAIINLIESYLFRRYICEMPTNSNRDTFKQIAIGIKEFVEENERITEAEYLSHIKDLFKELLNTARFPTDDDFERELKTFDRLYDLGGKSRAKYCLSKFEKYMNKEISHKDLKNDKISVEHIMPQTLTKEWKEDLGSDWERVHVTYLNTLGNLTITGYNAELGNRIFTEKRDLPGIGYKESSFKLTRALGELEEWNDTVIVKRAGILARIALEVWKYPHEYR